MLLKVVFLIRKSFDGLFTHILPNVPTVSLHTSKHFSAMKVVLLMIY